MFKKLPPSVVRFYQYKKYDASQLANYCKNMAWVSEVGQFNDPFEGKFKLISEPGTVVRSSDEFKWAFESSKKANPDLTEDEFEKAIKNPDFIKQNEDYVNSISYDLFKKHTAFCLTTAYDNLLMWAHYGDSYRGYCLVYELDFHKLFALDLTLKRQSYDVCQDKIMRGEEIVVLEDSREPTLSFMFGKAIYQPDIPKLNIRENENLTFRYQGRTLRDERHKHLFRHSIGVKSSHWSYENEYRLITNLPADIGKPGRPLDLNSPGSFLTITGVIMGVQLSDENKTALSREVNAQGLALYQARMNEKDYQINIDKVNVTNEAVLEA